MTPLNCVFSGDSAEPVSSSLPPPHAETKHPTMLTHQFIGASQDLVKWRRPTTQYQAVSQSGP